MKSLTVSLLILALLSGCGEQIHVSSPPFPKCVGIEESFNPYKIANPYTGRIWGTDTVIYTQFIFTDYVDYNILLYAERSWNMWVKFTNGTTTTYQNCFCNYLFVDKKYYAWTGFDYRGQYTSWDFYFETFDCSELSGSCNVVHPEIQDTLKYRFEGIR